MKNLLKSILLLFILTHFERCATTQRPEGGPKDTIPPNLLVSIPETGTTNFSDNTIYLEFDEYVSSDKLKANLIITPITKIKYKVIPKKRIVEIRLEEPLSDSTTYNFNFFKGITDITEKNPAVNLSIAFSTGPVIDSMSISGEVLDHLTRKKQKDLLVGLYPISDTLDFLSHSPLYFTTTLDSGEFNISYVKKGNYKLLTFDDKNNNLILDPKEEQHGFISDTIQLDSAITNIQLTTILQDVRPLQIVNARSIAQYGEITFNRDILDYELKPDSTISNIIGKEKDLIRIYNTGYDQDSVQFILNAKDSLNNIVTDTFKLLFQDITRRPAELAGNITFNYEVDTSIIYYEYNKPVSTLKNYALVTADTAYLDTLPLINMESNYHTAGRILFPYTTDTLLSKYYEHLLELDTNKLDSILPREPTLRNLNIQLPKGYFSSIENDTTRKEQLKIKIPKDPSYGTLILQTTKSDVPYFIQLLSRTKVKHAVSSNQEHRYNLTIPTGEYTIRVLYDNNADGKWSYGNLYQNIEPEGLQLFKEKTSLRENWVVELELVLKM